MARIQRSLKMFRKLLLKLFKIPKHPNIISFEDSARAAYCGFIAGLEIKEEDHERQKKTTNNQ